MATTLTGISSGIAIDVLHGSVVAHHATSDSSAVGFFDDQTGVVSDHFDRSRTFDRESDSDDEVITVVAAGAGVGGLWGIGIFSGLLPGIGPAITGGALSVLLSSAGTVVRLGVALILLGVPEDDAGYYESDLKARRTAVIVEESENAEAQAAPWILSEDDSMR